MGTTFTGTLDGPLSVADFGLDRVDNTPDMDKPVSTAQLDALNLKADLASVDAAKVETDASIAGVTAGTLAAIADLDAAITRLDAEMASLAVTIGPARPPGDGVTDAGPRIQALYDAGVQWVGNAGDSFLINSPVFLDRPNPYRGYSVDLNGAKIILGPKLPTTPSFYRDPATQWAFFANTKRAAWNKSTATVTVDAQTRATGESVGSLRPFMFRNGTVAAAGGNRALMFGNRCGGSFEGMTLSGAKALWSFFDYSDCTIIRMCHNRRDTEVPGSALFHQIANGDGVILESNKADGGMLIAYMSLCRGATISGNVTGGFVFAGCSAINVTGAHQEANIANTVNIRIMNSKVRIDGSVFFPARSLTVGTIEIVDSNLDFSVVELGAVQYHRFYSSSTTPDAPWGPLVKITTPMPGTLVRFRGVVASEVTSGGTTDGWTPSAGAWISSANAVWQAAITSASGAAQIATGSFQIGSYGGGVRARPLDQSVDHRATSVLGAVSMSGIDGASKLSGGALMSPATYSYVCALFDASGNSTAASTEATVTASASKTARLQFDVPASGELIVWRKAAAGAATSPTHWVKIYASRGGTFFSYDTGLHLAGIPWRTAPPPRPSMDTTTRAILIDGT